MIKIAILENDITQSQLIEQALIGLSSNWDEQAEVVRFEVAETLFEQVQSVEFDCFVLAKGNALESMNGRLLVCNLIDAWSWRLVERSGNQASLF